MRSHVHVFDEPRQSSEATSWGDQLCVVRCGRLATGLWEGRPVCEDCADELWDRACAREILRDSKAERDKRALLERVAHTLRVLGAIRG